jgi:hypothetical protein
MEEHPYETEGLSEVNAECWPGPDDDPVRDIILSTPDAQAKFPNLLATFERKAPLYGEETISEYQFAQGSGYPNFAVREGVM